MRALCAATAHVNPFTSAMTPEETSGETLSNSAVAPTLATMNPPGPVFWMSQSTSGLASRAPSSSARNVVTVSAIWQLTTAASLASTAQPRSWEAHASARRVLLLTLMSRTS